MNARHLDSKQLVLRALQGERFSRWAMGPLTVHYCARLAGHSLCDYAAAYARALADAGADMLSGGDSPAGLLGPRLYREAALPLQKRLIARLKAEAQVPISLHICGDATAVLPSMASSGADVLELDYCVPITEAAGRVGASVAIWGNLDPVSVLARGTAEQVRRATCDLLKAVDQCGHRRFVLSSGCTLAVETPRENLRAMFDTARQYA